MNEICDGDRLFNFRLLYVSTPYFFQLEMKAFRLCNISSMEVLYTSCFRIILLSFRKSTLTGIIPVLEHGSCGSDFIFVAEIFE